MGTGHRPKALFVEPTLPKRFKSKKKVVTHCLDEELWDKPEGDDVEEDDSDEEWDGHEDEDLDWEAEWQAEAGEFFVDEDEEDEDHQEADRMAENDSFLKDVQEHEPTGSRSFGRACTQPLADQNHPRLSTNGSRKSQKGKVKRPSRYAALAALKDQKVAPGFVVRRRASKMDEHDHQMSL